MASSQLFFSNSVRIAKTFQNEVAVDLFFQQKAWSFTNFYEKYSAFKKKGARGFKHENFRNILAAVIILETLMEQSYAPSRYEKNTLLDLAVLLIVNDLHGL